jgi:hypothetical protein
VQFSALEVGARARTGLSRGEAVWTTRTYTVRLTLVQRGGTYLVACALLADVFFFGASSPALSVVSPTSLGGSPIMADDWHLGTPADIITMNPAAAEPGAEAAVLLWRSSSRSGADAIRASQCLRSAGSSES